MYIGRHFLITRESALELGASIPQEFTVLDMRSYGMGRERARDGMGRERASACNGTGIPMVEEMPRKVFHQ